MADKCIRCGFNTKKTFQTYRERRRLIGNTYEWHRNYLRTSGVEDVEEESVICGKCRTKLNKERDIAVTDDPAVQSTDHDSTVVLEHITKISGPLFAIEIMHQRHWKTINKFKSFLLEIYI